MKTSSKRGLALAALAVASAAVLTFAACKTASGSVESVGTIPTPAGPVSFAGRVGLNDNTWNAHNDTNSQFRIRFFDAAGNVVGEGTITVGGSCSGTLPETATRWEAIAGPSTPAPGGGGEGGGGTGRMYDGGDTVLVINLSSQEQSSGARQRAGSPQEATRFTVIGGPLWFDRDSTSENALYCFMIWASDEAEALGLSRDTIEAPIGSPIDSQVDVQTFFKAYEDVGSAHMVALAKHRFSSFAVDFNNQVDYATLGNGATQTSLGGGLYRIDVPVSYLDIHGYGQTNWFSYRTFHGGNPTMQIGNYDMIHEL